MRVRLDGRPGRDRIEFAEFADLSRLELTICAMDEAEVRETLAEEGVGELATREHAWLDIDRLRVAGSGIDATWTDRFEAAMAYARGSGWISADLGSVRAHCLWLLEQP